MKIALIIWSNPEMYINLLFTAKKLLESKNKIYIFCRGYPKNLDSFKYFKYFKKIKIINVGESDNKFFDKINILILIFKSIYFISIYKIDRIIAYNFHGLLIAKINWLINKRLKIIYHNFDFEEKDINLSQKIQTILKKKIINNIEAVITPSENRSKIFKKKFLLKKMPISMLNTFPKDFKIKKKNSHNSKKIITRLGSYNYFHSIENLILSSKYLNKNYQIIIAGKSYNNFYDKMKKIVTKNKMKNITLLKDISYKEWFKILSKADLGVALYDEVNTSHRNMAGTSQKLNNYILANVPSLVRQNSEFIKFNKKHNISYLLKKDNPKKIAEKIEEIFKNKKFYNQKIKNNKFLYQNILNFEFQYQKIKKLFDEI